MIAMTQSQSNAATRTIAGRTVVVGLGRTGLSCARHLRSRNVSFAVTDSRAAPPELDALKTLAPNAQVSLGRFDEAVKELDTAITLGGDQMKEAHRYLGAIYHARGDDKRAINELETYLRIAPKADDAEPVRQLIQQLKSKQ